jgi:8-oxo-dGTP diphosphatase
MKQFGKKPADDFFERPGAYGIIVNHEQKVAVLHTPNGFHLPGGGQDDDESFEDTLKRETLEEMGCEIEIQKKIGVGGQYCFAKDLQRYLNKIEHFYLAECLGVIRTPIESDHCLNWMTISECLENLTDECQQWAVLQIKSDLV